MLLCAEDETDALKWIRAIKASALAATAAASDGQSHDLEAVADASCALDQVQPFSSAITSLDAEEHFKNRDDSSHVLVVKCGGNSPQEVSQAVSTLNSVARAHRPPEFSH